MLKPGSAALAGSSSEPYHPERVMLREFQPTHRRLRAPRTQAKAQATASDEDTGSDKVRPPARLPLLSAVCKGTFCPISCPALRFGTDVKVL